MTMRPFAFLFPGQGSQAVGMLQGWGDAPAVRQTLDEASEALGEDVARLIREGPKDQLDLTTNTQPVMLTAGIACYRAWLAEGGPEPSVVAGHSLGEYAALVAAGSLSLTDALPLVRFRAQAMQEAVPVGVGAMAAILGLDAGAVRRGCESVAAETGEVVEAVNFNDPKQTVIAGSKAGVEQACNALKAAGAKRALLLPVSAPFHSSLMKPAADRLKQRLDAYPFRRPFHRPRQQRRCRSAAGPGSDPRGAVPAGLQPGALGRVGRGDPGSRRRCAHRVRSGQSARRHRQANRCRRRCRRAVRPVVAERSEGVAGMSERSSAGQIALVTGASRGIGHAIALALAGQGMKVVGTSTTEAGAASVTTALAAFPDCHGAVLNVDDGEAIGAVVEGVVSRHGAIHVLVNNAGITRDTLAMRMRDEDWDAVVDTNLKAVFRLSRAVMRSMVKQRYGRIVNITSVVGASGNPGQANYAAAKAGVAGLTRALARELGGRGITVNCVAPGFIETDMTKGLSAAQTAALLGQIPIGRLGQAAEVADAVAFLASPRAGYITGTELHVNGGMFMS
jgi:3-oxoacyl-[acyl-carrier protein] reductase